MRAQVRVEHRIPVDEPVLLCVVDAEDDSVLLADEDKAPLADVRVHLASHGSLVRRRRGGVDEHGHEGR